MNKVKTLVVAAVAAAAIGTGGLVSAPPASAKSDPNLCRSFQDKGRWARAMQYALGAGGYSSSAYTYKLLADSYYNSARYCWGDL